jgi:hypothetical protein
MKISKDVISRYTFLSQSLNHPKMDDVQTSEEDIKLVSVSVWPVNVVC